jgi:hypothetical protein
MQLLLIAQQAATAAAIAAAAEDSEAAAAAATLEVEVKRRPATSVGSYNSQGVRPRIHRPDDL